MRASEVLQRWMGESLQTLLDRRLVRRLVGAVDALVASGQLVLMELARQYPEATRVAAPLKALDRLLSNPAVQSAVPRLYAAALERLWPYARPWILVDWCVLKADESLHLLRAAVPVGGRCLPVLDAVHPQNRQGHPDAQLGFLVQLRAVLPTGRAPILITDAGFKAPWFKTAESLGFSCIGRLRGAVQLRPVGEADWVEARGFNAYRKTTILDLGVCEIGKGPRKRMRVVIAYTPPKGRVDSTTRGTPARDSRSLAHAKGAREPWVLVASTALESLSARAIVQHYGRRMQIEESFRDLKSPRFGSGLRHSLTRKAKRMQVLLMIHALASIVATVVGLLARHSRLEHRLLPNRQAIKRQALSQLNAVLSVWRVGWEILARGWLSELWDAGESRPPATAHPLLQKLSGAR